MTENLKPPSDELILLTRRIAKTRSVFFARHGILPDWVRLPIGDLDLLPEGSSVQKMQVIEGTDDIEVGLSAIEEFESTSGGEGSFSTV